MEASREHLCWYFVNWRQPVLSLYLEIKTMEMFASRTSAIAAAAAAAAARIWDRYDWTDVCPIEQLNETYYYTQQEKKMDKTEDSRDNNIEVAIIIAIIRVWFRYSYQRFCSWRPWRCSDAVTGAALWHDYYCLYWCPLWYDDCRPLAFDIAVPVAYASLLCSWNSLFSLL